MNANMRKKQIQGACQGRTPLAHHQVAFRLCEDPLQRVGEEHALIVCGLRVGQDVRDIQKTVATVGGVMRARYGKRGANGPVRDEKQALSSCLYGFTYIGGRRDYF
jgi:hypothetical protein